MPVKSSHREVWLAVGLIAVLATLNTNAAIHSGIISVDVYCAHLFNSVLQGQPQLATVFAWMNTRYGDCIVLMLMGILFLSHALRAATLNEACQRLAYWGWTGVLCLTTYVGICGLEDLWPRHIPIASLPDLINVQTAYGIKLRTSADACFPSGHGFAYSLFVMMSWKPYRQMSLALATIGLAMLTLRLVLGVHWVSDIALGAFPLAFLVTAIALETPLYRTYGMMTSLVHKVAIALHPKYIRFPLSFVAQDSSAPFRTDSTEGDDVKDTVREELV